MRDWLLGQIPGQFCTKCDFNLIQFTSYQLAQNSRGRPANVAAEFLSRSLSSGETIAILLRRDSLAETLQRIVPLDRALQPRYLGWLAHENAAGANVNQKYDPAHLVSVEYLTDSTSNPTDFRLAIRDVEGTLLASRICPRKGSEKSTNSEHDWAWILHELSCGKDAGELTRALAERRPDKPNPLYYAQRTVDVASARLWLAEGVPMADVITMLQVRRRSEIPSALCSARAREIALTAQRMIVRQKIA